MNILVVAFDVLNPNSIGWIHGFQELGHHVSVIVTNESDLSREKLSSLGFYDDKHSRTPIFQHRSSSETRKEVINLFAAEPDIIFFWEGIGILPKVKEVAHLFKNSKKIFCINTYPNCATRLREFLTNQLHRQLDSLIHSYIFYSKEQRKLFFKAVKQASTKPSMVMIDPFFESAFSSSYKERVFEDKVLKLHRFDDQPHVIFTGNARKLWDKPVGHGGKDALGPFFKDLSQHGVHIFVHESADLRDIPNLHTFPTFHNPDLINGSFSRYISQFDAHLVIYNEHTPTEVRRVSTGLATRFSYALTATCPIAVTETSIFAKNLWKDCPFGFSFKDIEDLAIFLRDQGRLRMLRSNMEKLHKRFSFEAQVPALKKFFQETLNVS